MRCQPASRPTWVGRNAHTAALAQAHVQVADLDDRLKTGVAAEREASARSNQQATSLVESAARLQQQLASSRVGMPKLPESAPRHTMPRTLSTLSMVTGPSTRCLSDPRQRLHPSLGTPPSRTPSTAPAARAPSSKRPASLTSRMTSIIVTTEDMEVIHYLPTHCCTSLVTVTTPMSHHVSHMLHHNGQQPRFTLRHYSIRHRC